MKYQLNKEHLVGFFHNYQLTHCPFLFAAPFPYPVKNCGKATHKNEVDTLYATLPFNRTLKYCRVVYPDTASSNDNYIITVDMFHDGNRFENQTGISGIIFNAQDVDNFQFIYVK